MFPSAGNVRRTHDASGLRRVRAGRAAVHGARASSSGLSGGGVCSECSVDECIACPNSPVMCMACQQGHFLSGASCEKCAATARVQRGEWFV